jgi:K+-sensing histidine kinase KdpD
MENPIIKKSGTCDLISAINNAANLSNFLVQDLLDNRMLENRNFRIKYEWFDLRQTVADMTLILQPQAKTRGNRFEIIFS